MVSLFRYRLPGTWMRHFQARKAKNRPVSGSSSADISSPSPNKEHKKKQWQSAEE